MLHATASRRRPRHSAKGIELPRVDQRTISARRFRGLIESFEIELGGGGLTATEKGLVKQVASLQLRIEQLQSAIVEGCDVNADEIIRLSSEHRRLLVSLRAKAAKNKPGGPDLASYLASKSPTKANAEPADADDEPIDQ